jgi:hypothetical protein
VVLRHGAIVADVDSQSVSVADLTALAGGLS